MIAPLAELWALAGRRGAEGEEEVGAEEGAGADGEEGAAAEGAWAGAAGAGSAAGVWAVAARGASAAAGAAVAAEASAAKGSAEEAAGSVAEAEAEAAEKAAGKAAQVGTCGVAQQRHGERASTSPVKGGEGIDRTHASRWAMALTLRRGERGPARAHGAQSQDATSGVSTQTRAWACADGPKEGQKHVKGRGRGRGE